jgi:hypothetical protein
MATADFSKVNLLKLVKKPDPERQRLTLNSSPTYSPLLPGSAADSPQIPRATHVGTDGNVKGVSPPPGISESDKQATMFAISQAQHMRENLGVTEDGDSVIIDFSDCIECPPCTPCFGGGSSWIPTADDLKKACSFVLDNEAKTPHGQAFTSFVNIRLRCFLSVDIWTTARQAVARALGLLSIKYPILGWALGATPIVYVLSLLCIGYVYDKWNSKATDELLDDFIAEVENSIKATFKEESNSDDDKIENKATTNKLKIDAFMHKLVGAVRQAHSNDDSRIEVLKKLLFANPINSTTLSQEDAVEINLEFNEATTNLDALSQEDDIEINLELDEATRPSLTNLDDLISKIKTEAGLNDQACIKLKQRIQTALEELEKNIKYSTWTTKCTTVTRIISAILISVLGGATAYLVILPKIGATLFAFTFSYCDLRDVTQIFFPFKSDVEKLTMGGAFKSGLKYAVNQALAGFFSSWLAGLSGQAGINLSFLEALKYDALRGHINGLFEAIDTWCIYYDQCNDQDLELKVGLTFDASDFWAKFVNTFTGIGSMRPCAFNELILFESLFFNFVEIDENVADLGKKAIISSVDGLYLGIPVYTRLIAMMRVNWPHDGFMQNIGNMWR